MNDEVEGAEGGGRWATFVILAFAVLAIGACGVFAFSLEATDDGSTTSDSDGPTTHRVDYYVQGTCSSVDVTYNNAGGDTEQMSDVDVPWSKTLNDVPAGQFLYISAQNNDDSGTVVTKILVDGRELKRSESEGAYVIASCSGSAE